MTATDTTGRADAPAGYRAVKVTPGFDQFAKTDPSAEGPAWLTLCVEHGTTKPADSQRAAKSQGWTAKRVAWCKSCAKASGR